MRKSTLLAVVLLATAIGAGAAGAQGRVGTINSTFNTSARFEGMGSAGVGAPWGQDTDHWANPAALAYRRGACFNYFRSKLAAGLADDIVLTNKELILGARGLTVLLATGPGLGNKLDMGEQLIVDVDNNETGSEASWQETESLGVAVDAVRVLDGFLGRSDPQRPALSRALSLSGGIVRHSYEDRLTADQTIQDGVIAGGSAQIDYWSLGYQVRVEPLALLREPILGNSKYDLRGGAGYGRSVLNRTDDFLEYPGSDSTAPVARLYLSGWSVHAEAGLSEAWRNRPRQGIAALVLQAIDPLLSFTYAKQTMEPGVVYDGRNYVYEHDTSGLFDEKGSGWEVGCLNVLYFRRGHYSAEWGQIDGDTKGWGINLQLGKLAGIRYDRAEVPQATGLPDVTRHGASIWVDFLALRDREP